MNAMSNIWSMKIVDHIFTTILAFVAFFMLGHMTAFAACQTVEVCDGYFAGYNVYECYSDVWIYNASFESMDGYNPLNPPACMLPVCYAQTVCTEPPPPPSCWDLGNCPCEWTGTCAPPVTDTANNPPPTCEQLGTCTCEYYGNCPAPTCWDLGSCPCEWYGTCPAPQQPGPGPQPEPELTCWDLGNCPCERYGDCGVWEDYTPPPPPPPPGCSATTINNCVLPSVSSGSGAGSCVAGTVGSCSYTCYSGIWSFNGNSCTLPQVDLTASPRIVERGSTVVLTATLNGATNCTITGGGKVTAVTKTTTQDFSETLQATTTFTLTCTAGTLTASDSVTVEIVPKMFES